MMEQGGRASRLVKVAAIRMTGHIEPTRMAKFEYRAAKSKEELDYGR